MDLTQLKYFMTVARLEHMSRAASELNLSQPALSLTIRRMEEEIGAPLFEKNGRNIQLSPYGKHFYAKAAPAYEQLVDAIQTTRQLKEASSERIFVYGPPMFSFPQLMQKVSQLQPKTGLRNVECTVDEALQRLKNNQGDFALLLTLPDFTPDPQRFECRKFLRNNLVCLLPLNHPLAAQESVSLSDLSGVPMATYPEGMNIRPVVEKLFYDQHCFFNIAFETVLIFDLLAFVRSGQACTIIPNRVFELHDLRQHKVLPISSPDVSYCLTLVWAKNGKKKKMFYQLQELLVEYFEDNQDSGRA